MAEAARHRATLGTAHRVPHLRVRFSADGIMQGAVFPTFGPQDSPSDGWWQAAARDWRRAAERPGAQCLGWINHRPVWTVECPDCGLRKDFQYADLLKRFGLAYYVDNASYDAILCPKQRGRATCRVTFAKD